MSMLMIFFLCEFFCSLFDSGEKRVFGYDLTKPEKEIVLPGILHEISGITQVDDHTIACVQDENGVVFFYDTFKKEIVKQLAFAYDGDYEDITMVGKSLYILRSDGAIFEIPDAGDASQSANYYESIGKAGDNEGLCFDSKRRRLLLATKGEVEDEDRSSRVIYAFDLETKRFYSKPAYDFNIAEVTQFAAKQGIVDPFRFTKKGKVRPNLIKLRMSGIAFHPRTGELYVLAAEDFLLLVFNRKGQMRHAKKLDEKLFNQAEGITFLDNGDMFISNEGGEGRPRLLKFQYRL